MKKFKVIKASAGSGKTFTLTTEYISLILSSRNEHYFQHILAITFTIKAAAEMKHRILETLKFLAYEKDKSKLYANAQANDIIEKLSEKHQLKVEEIQRRALKAFTNIIHNYSDLSISTIDKFTHRIVRTFAKDLNLSVNFNIEIDESETINKAVNLLINKIGEDDFITEILTDFVIDNFKQEKSWKIENTIAQISSLLSKNKYEKLNDKIGNINKSNYLKNRKELKEIKQKILDQFLEIAKNLLQICERNGINPLDFSRGSKGIGSKFIKFSKIKENEFLGLDFNITFHKYIAGESDLYAKSADPNLKMSIDAVQPEIFQTANRLFDFFEENKEKYLLADTALKEFNLIILSDYLQNSIVEIKKESNVVFMSEFNQLIANVIKGEHAPYIYERLGEKYNHYMIDEFQDTSVLQWSNLIPLVDNSLASGHESLVVGDSKQAIYRWRGGEVEQFYKLPKLPFLTDNEIGQIQEKNLEYNFDAVNLEKNFRSEKELVDFNNELFSYLKEILPEDFKEIYDENEQIATKANLTGYVEINLLENSKRYNSNSESGEDEEDDDNPQDLILLQEQITSLVNSKLYSYKDMSVICRKGSDLVKVANYLNENNIPCISEEGLLLSSSHKVEFLTNVLYFINNPKEDAFIIKMFEFFVLEGKMQKEEFAALGKFDAKEKKETYLALYNRFIIFLNTIGIKDFDIKDLKTKNLYELVENIIHIFSINEDYDTYVHGFVERVFEYTNKLNSDQSDFLKWWDDKKSKFSIKIPENIDAIRLLTIHKSKGLQFPVVFCPFFNWDIVNRNGDKVWLDLKDGELPDIQKCIINSADYGKFGVDSEYYKLLFDEYKKNILDNINLMYVALTRAEEQMYITTKELGKTKTNNLSSILESLTFEDLGGKISDYLGVYLLKNKDNWREEASGKFIYQQNLGVVLENKQLKKSKSASTKVQLSENIKKINLQKVITNPWEDRVKISRVLYTDEDFVSLLDKQIKGNIIHDVLSEIKQAEEFEIKNIINKKVIRGMISNNETNEVLHQILKVVKHENCKIYFEDKPNAIIRNETELLDENGKSFRPDKMIFEDNMVTVVDFKTGNFSTKHQEQVKTYLHLLQQQGYKKLKGVLIYTQPVKVVEVL